MIQLIFQLAKFALPISAGYLLQALLNSVSLMMVGRVGSAELGALALSFSLFNATAGSAIIGLAASLDTLLSHIAGANAKDPNYGNVAARAYIIIIFMTIPFAAMFSWLDVLLTWIELDPELVLHTVTYSRTAMFQIPFVLCSEVAKRFIQNQGSTTPIAVISAMALALHTLLQYVLVIVLDLRLFGSAVGWVIIQAFIALAFLANIRRDWQRFEGTWVGVSGALLEDWWPIVYEGAPSWGMTLVEWSAFEVSNMTAGYLSTVELASYAVVLQSYFVFWSMGQGIGVAGSVFVGKALGAGRPLEGRQAVKAAQLITFGWALITAFSVVVFGGQIAWVFTDDEAVVKRSTQVFRYVAVFAFLDLTQSCFINISRGVAKQGAGALICFVTWIVVGIPLNMLFTFQLGMGAPGLFLGLIVACAAVSAPAFTWYLLKRLDWTTLKAVT